MYSSEDIQFDNEFVGSLELAIEGETLSLQLKALSKKRVLVSVSDSQRELLEGLKGTTLNKAAIIIQSSLQGRVDLNVGNILVPGERRRAQDTLNITETSIVLTPSDDVNKATLWEVLYHTNSLAIATANRNAGMPKDLVAVPGRNLYTEAARAERMEFVKARTGVNADLIAENSFDPEKLSSNIEGFVGSIEIPVGLAGPLKINGQHAHGIFYSPMATTEGALVASMTRGASAISDCGGVVTRVLGQRMIRAPQFTFKNLQSAIMFNTWVKDHFDEIKEEAQKFSNYADLQEVEPEMVGSSVHVHFVYETGDAAGQNMTTTCTWHACLWILNQIKVYPQLALKDFIVDGNQSSDKKVSYRSFIKGRGIRVQAEVIISKEVMRKKLKVDPVAVYQGMVRSKSGGFATGLVGFNVNIANAIGAMFAVLGQDIASVHESSVGNLLVDLTEDQDLHLSLTLPCLVIGTVGGGTNLPQQHQALEMIGCAGPGKAHKLAEIIAGYCLALDLSTMSAMSAGHFARAHERLGRNRPVDVVKIGELTPEWFTQHMQQQVEDDTVEVLAVSQIKDFTLGSSIINAFTSDKVNKTIGLFPYSLRVKSAKMGEKDVNVMVKMKATSYEYGWSGAHIAGFCDSRLASEYEKHMDEMGTKDCDRRELAVFRQKDEAFTRMAPKVYGIYEEPEREAFILVEELLEDMELMDSADDISGWTSDHITCAIRDIAKVHALWLGKKESLREKPWIGHYMTPDRMTDLSRLIELLGIHGSEEFPEWFTLDDLNIYREKIRDIPNWWAEIEQMPMTLIHGDYNPRNLAFRRENDQLQTIAYDWELATVHIPQRDLVELLIFTLDENVTCEQIKRFAEYHREQLMEVSGVNIDADQWWQGVKYCVWDFMLYRSSIYLMVHTFKHYGFMERIWSTLRRILAVIEE